MSSSNGAMSFLVSVAMLTNAVVLVAQTKCAEDVPESGALSCLSDKQRCAASLALHMQMGGQGSFVKSLL